MSDYWIVDPVGHRVLENENRRLNPPPETVETEFGEAFVIDTTTTMPVDLYICDSCNAEMVIQFGDEPWPAPVVGGYALCCRCMAEMELDPPTRACSCVACSSTWARWHAERIDEAIDGYAQRAGEGGDGAAPYNAASLAEIYAPRVRQLMELEAAGFTHAFWAQGEWHGARTKGESDG
jgi:hypothetical protein